MGEAFITRKSGGSINKSMVFVTAPEGTTSVIASYKNTTIKGKIKNNYWQLTNLTYGPEVTWTVTATNGIETSIFNILMEKLEIKYIEINYWNGKLYDHGNAYDPITGGWEAKLYPSNSSHDEWYGEGKISLTKNKENMVVTFTQDTSKMPAGILKTINEIDLTNFDLLTVNLDYDSSSSDSNLLMGSIAITKPKFNHWEDEALVSKDIPKGEKQNITVDISKISQKCFILIGITSAWIAGTRTGKITIHEITLTKKQKENP